MRQDQALDRQSLAKLHQQALCFPAIHLQRPINIYIDMLSKMHLKALRLLGLHRPREAYVLLLRCCIIGVEHLPHHSQYRKHRATIRQRCNAALAVLEPLAAVASPITAPSAAAALSPSLNTLHNRLMTMGLRKHDVPSDGDCQFHSLSDQLRYHSVASVTSVPTLRSQLARFLESHCHVHMDDGSTGGSVTLMHALGYFDTASWHEYIAGVRTNAWGDAGTLLAACGLFKVCVVVLSSEGNLHTIQCPALWQVPITATLYLVHIWEVHYSSTRGLRETR